MGSAVLPFWYLLLKGKLAEHCVKVVLRSLQLLGENALSIHHHLNKGYVGCVCGGGVCFLLSTPASPNHEGKKGNFIRGSCLM